MKTMDLHDLGNLDGAKTDMNQANDILKNIIESSDMEAGNKLKVMNIRQLLTISISMLDDILLKEAIRSTKQA